MGKHKILLAIAGLFLVLGLNAQNITGPSPKLCVKK